MKLTFSFKNVAVLTVIALSSAFVIIGFQFRNVEHSAVGTRVAEYTSISQLNRDASLVAVLQPVDGKRQSTAYPTAVLPTSKFKITNASDPTLINTEITVVLPSQADLSEKIRNGTSLDWLIPLTFDSSVNERTWVVVGDGAGLFLLSDTKARSQDTFAGYSKVDTESTKLPDRVSFSEGSPQKPDRPTP